MNRHLRHTMIAALLAAMWVVTPMLGAIHLALEVHTYCAEHNTLEEGATHHGMSEVRMLEADSHASVRSTDRGAPDRDSHTACSFGDLATRDTIAFDAFDAFVVIDKAPATGPSDRLVDEGIARSSRRLLLAAPKTSPPSAA